MAQTDMIRQKKIRPTASRPRRSPWVQRKKKPRNTGRVNSRLLSPTQITMPLVPPKVTTSRTFQGSFCLTDTKGIHSRQRIRPVAMNSRIQLPSTMASRRNAAILQPSRAARVRAIMASFWQERLMGRVTSPSITSLPETRFTAPARTRYRWWMRTKSGPTSRATWSSLP